MEGEGEGEGEMEGEGLYDCPENTSFGQGATNPAISPEFIHGYYVSDDKYYPEGAMPWDSFVITSTLNSAASLYLYISDLHWWGVESLPDASCEGQIENFKVEIAESPYTLPVWSAEVIPEKAPAFFYAWSEDTAHPVYAYDVSLVSEPPVLEADKEYWINIRGADASETCSFGWLTTNEGDMGIRLYNGSEMYEEKVDNLAFCLTATAPPAAPAELVAINIKRLAGNDYAYVPGTDVEITVRLELTGQGEITALDLLEQLPAGWSFAGITDGAAPDVLPVVGATGALEFSWNTVPSFPVEFTYAAEPPESEEVFLFMGVARYMIGGETCLSNEAQTQIRRYQTIFVTDRSTGPYVGGEELDITVSYERHGLESLLVFGLVENLPAGWTFQGIVESSGTPPDVYPDVNTAGVLEFAWFTPPAMPGSFTYRVYVPEWTSGLARISGYGLYRFTESQFMTAVTETVVPRSLN